MAKELVALGLLTRIDRGAMLNAVEVDATGVRRERRSRSTAWELPPIRRSHPRVQPPAP